MFRRKVDTASPSASPRANWRNRPAATFQSFGKSVRHRWAVAGSRFRSLPMAAHEYPSAFISAARSNWSAVGRFGSFGLAVGVEVGAGVDMTGSSGVSYNMYTKY